MRALGLMSGTSMDGVDAAVLETDGETIAGFGPSGLRALCAGGAGGCCAAALGRWPGDAGLEAVEALVRAAHAAAVAGFDGRRGRRLPRPDAGARAAGAGDAPGRAGRLAGAGRRACRWSGTSAPPTWRAAARGRRWCRSSTSPARGWIGAEAPVAFLNLGGVGNVTWVDPRAAAPEARGGARRLRHRAGERADRRFPRRCGSGGPSTRTARSRRRGGWTTAVLAGLGGASLSRKDAAEVAGPAGFSRLPRPGRAGSRPRTGRRRWRR